MAKRSIALLITCLFLVAACSNAAQDGASGPDAAGGETPGVSEDTIRVGGVGSLTNPIGVEAESTFEGAQAYFDMINEDGGVGGRTIEVVATEDDSAQASRNASLVRSLVEQDEVFAVNPVATLSFSGASYLADEGVPTFGWNINTEWSGPPTLFGEKGSTLCFDCPAPFVPYLASESGATEVGIIAYTASQSQACADGQRASYEAFGDELGVDLVFEDTSLGFGFTPGALDADLREMRDKGVDFLSTCVDGVGSGRLAEAIEDAGLDVVQYLPNGYDPEIIEEFGDVLQGSYVTSFAVPFAADQPPEAMQRYLSTMESEGIQVNENSLAGWISADMFVTGLQAVEESGEELTRQSLVEAINAMDDYDAGGISSGTDWSISHDRSSPDPCIAFMQIDGEEFAPILGEPGEPFVCLNRENPEFDNPTIRG